MKFTVISFLVWMVLFSFYLEQNGADAGCSTLFLRKKNVKKAKQTRSRRKSIVEVSVATALAPVGIEPISFDVILQQLTEYCQQQPTSPGCTQNSLGAMKSWLHDYIPQLNIELKFRNARDALFHLVFTILDEIAKSAMDFKHLKMCELPFSTQLYILEKIVLSKKVQITDITSVVKSWIVGATDLMAQTPTYRSHDGTLFVTKLGHTSEGFEIFCYYSDYNAGNRGSSPDVLAHAIGKYKARLLKYGKLDWTSPQDLNVIDKVVELFFIELIEFIFQSGYQNLDEKQAEAQLSQFIAFFANQKKTQMNRESDETKKATFTEAYAPASKKFKGVKRPDVNKR